MTAGRPARSMASSPSAAGPRSGTPVHRIRPLPCPLVGIQEPRLLGGDVARELTVGAPVGVTLDRQIVFSRAGIGRQPVDEQQGELLVGPAVHPQVHVGRPTGIRRGVHALVPQSGTVGVVVAADGAASVGLFGVLGDVLEAWVAGGQQGSASSSATSSDSTVTWMSMTSLARKSGSPTRRLTQCGQLARPYARTRSLAG